MKKQLLFLFAALLPMLASAQTKVEVDGIWYNIITKGKVAEVTFKGDSYYEYDDEYSGSITLPATVTYEGVNYSVTSIGKYAFYKCRSLTAITLPEGVTSIGEGAFSGCSSLTAINIPEGVTSIGEGAFSGCSSLTAITIPEGVTSIGEWAFSSCSSLTAITIPEGVTSIGEGAFSGCSSLTAITLPEGVTSIEDYAFRDCSSLTAITIPESVTSIGDYAFSGCSSLTAITLPEGVTSIGDYAFSGCSSLTAITIPEGVTSIGKYAFDGCSSLTAITLPEGVTSIRYYAFSGCSSLTAITLPEGVTSIEDYAFRNCSSLTAITIPEGVTSIGYYAFSGCSSLTSITIPESVTSIGNYAFQSCCSLTAITIPEGVTSIGYAAFDNCTALKEVIFEDGSETLSLGYNYYSSSTGQGLFYDCPLESVYLGRNLSYSSDSSYGYSPFYNKTKLTSVVIGDGVMSIGKHAFRGCSSLTAITIPENSQLTSIEWGAFADCSSLTAITLPEGVTSIGKYAFDGCSSLTTVVLPKNLKKIYSEAFANCSELLDVYCYAEKVPSTESDAFDGSYIEYATLHVPASALETYKTTSPWSSFGTIVSLPDEKVTSITLNHTEATLTEGQTLTLIATIAPGYATNKAVTWSSSNPSVATVDNTGKVTAIAPGTATITATAGDGSGVSASCEVTVEAMPTEVTITINQYGSATYCSEYALDFSNVEGLKAYAATGYNNITGIVTLTRVMTTQPGTGLFLKGEPGTYEVPMMETSADHTINMLVGTLAPTLLNKTSDDGLYANYKYTIKEGETEPKFYQFTDGSTMGAGKAYLQIPTAWLPAGETRSIGLRFDEGEGTTDMEEFTIDNSQLTIIYDLYGRRVAQPVKGGIYIVNGRKVVY